MDIPLRHVILHGHDITYRLAEADPAKPTLLLIHGMAGNSRTWKDVMPDLADDFTVLAPDLIGHGESAKPMGDYSLGAFASGLRDLLAKLEIGSVTVIGHSLGGGVAMQLAYQHPELVDRLVLIGSGGLGREVSWLLRLLTLPGAEYLMPLFFPQFVRDGGDELGKAIHDRGWSLPHVGEMWRAYASLGQAENRKAFVRTLRAVIDPAARGTGFTAYVTVGLSSHTKASQEAFERAIIRSPEVRECHNITGSYEYLLRVEAADLAAYKIFHTDVLGVLPQVSSITSFVVMGSPKDDRA